MPGIVKRISHRAASMIRRPRIDLPLLGALFLLAMIGLATQYSASDLNVDQAMAQGIRLSIGGLLMFVIARVPPSRLRNWTPWLYVASIVLLLACCHPG